MVTCALLGLLVAVGCGSGTPDAARAATRVTETPPGPAAPSRPLVVALGDSLTAGLGLPKEQAYPALLQQKIDAEGYGFEVVNAGVSGDTTAGGVRRFDWAMQGEVRVLIVALGGNDGLRGLPVEAVRHNLEAIINQARDRGVLVLLCGMEAPPNFGQDFTNAFRATYRDLGAQPGVTFLPFLLEGVAGVSSLNQSDGIHPNAEGARRVADLVWASLQPMLRAVAAQS